MEAIVLPRGVGDAGEGGRPVWIRPWDGRDEMELFSDAGASAAVTVTALLSRCVCTDPGGTPVDPDFARSSPGAELCCETESRLPQDCNRETS